MARWRLAVLYALAGCGGSAETLLAADPHLLPAATGVDLAWVAVYQGQERVLFDAGVGAQVGSVPPILAGRELAVRVGLDTLDGVPARDLAVLLQVQQGNGGAFNHLQVARVRRPNADALESTVNFTVPGEEVGASVKLEISLREIALRPVEEHPLGAWTWTSPRIQTENTDWLQLVIVPVQILDGQTYTPDTSPEQLALIRSIVAAEYPVSDVQIAVDEPLSWSGSFGSSADWSELLDRVIARRAAAEPERANTYYYGAVAPPDAGVGIAGLSPLAMSVEDDWARASVGWGYPGEESVDVLLHEVGHAHGRDHVDCGNPAGPDPNYPHDPATIGIRAWDRPAGEILGPADAKDIMTYCTPTYVSDYTYEKLHERILALRGARSARPRIAGRGWVDGAGAGPVTGSLRVAADPAGEPVWVRLMGADGAERAVVEGWFHPYGHGEGGVVLFDGDPGAAASLELAGARPGP